ncbi:MAG: hypothetical protein WDA74_12395 [Spirochaetota bacterium]
MMKYFKIIIPAILVFIIGIYIYNHGVRDLFTLGAVKRVRVQGVEALEREVEINEKKFWDKMQSMEQVGESYKKLGIKYAEMKSWTPAIDTLTKAIEHGQSGAYVHYWLGIAYANRGNELKNKSDIDKAEASYKRALEKIPTLTHAEYGLALLYFYLKEDRGKGLQMMNDIVRKKPDYFDAHFALGRFYYENDEKNKSLSVYQNLYSLLESKKESFQITELKKNCQTNITQLMMEISPR